MKRRRTHTYPWIEPSLGMVYMQGLKVIPLSIDLWTHYIGFTKSKLKDTEDEIVTYKLRELYESAVKAAGIDFRSDRLWELYIGWEKEQGNLARVTALYDRLIAIPTYLYSIQFDRFIKHIKSAPPKQLLSLDEFLKLRKEVVKSASSIQAGGHDDDDDEDGPPGVIGPEIPEVPPGEDPAKYMSVTDLVVSDEETEKLQEKIISIRQEIHTLNEAEVGKRWTYEEGIRRPYFHVKPLERPQLKNWKEYLDFEIELGNHSRVLVLFERCMVACALYEEFWLKYAKYMESRSVEGARGMFRHACTVHLPTKPNLHLAWATFEERQGNITAALEILTSLRKRLPGLAMVTLRLIGLERRQCHFSRVEELYQEQISAADKPEEASFYAIKYARYLSKVIANSEKANEVLQTALSKDKANHKLYLQLIDSEYQKASLDETSMLAMFDQTIHSKLAIDHRVAFSQRRLEFLEDFSSSVMRVMDAYEEHQKLVRELQSSRKRKAHSNNEGSEALAAKKSKTTEASATGPNGTTEAMAAQQPTSTTMDAMATAPAMTPQQQQHYNYAQYYGNYYQQPGWGSYGPGYGGQPYGNTPT